MLLDAGMSIDKLQRYVGHADGSNTLRYLQNSDEEIEAEIDRLKSELAIAHASGD
jgi:hypothetical protein